MILSGTEPAFYTVSVGQAIGKQRRVTPLLCSFALQIASEPDGRKAPLYPSGSSAGVLMIE